MNVGTYTNQIIQLSPEVFLVECGDGVNWELCLNEYKEEFNRIPVCTNKIKSGIKLPLKAYGTLGKQLIDVESGYSGWDWQDLGQQWELQWELYQARLNG